MGEELRITLTAQNSWQNAGGMMNMEFSVHECSESQSDLSEDFSVPDRPVDLVHLARQTLGNRVLECEVLEMFRRQSVLNVDRLKSADSDKAWRDVAHTIKGSARGIGAWQIADLAEEIEQLQGAALTEKRDVSILALEREISTVNDFIVSLLVEK